MNNKTSISNRVTVFLIGIIVLLIISFTSLFIIQIILHYDKDYIFTKEVFFDYKKDLLKTVVSRTTFAIREKQKEADYILRKTVKEKTENAYRTIEHIYSLYKNKLSKEQIRKISIEMLRPVRWDNGRGYFFAFNSKGIEKLFPVKPNLENKNLLNLKSSDGKFVLKDMIKIAKEKGEGFYLYKWSKPNAKGNNHQKISFIKYFEPLDLIVGSGGYLEDTIAKLQSEIIKRIEKVRFNNGGYIFVGTYDGIALSGPAKGKNAYNFTDKNGLKVVQELIKKAKKGGGFVEYVMPKATGVKEAAKLSYVEGVDEWNWYVGSGVYIDEIQSLVNKKYKDLRRSIINNLILGLVFLIIFVIVSIYFVKKFRRRLDSNIKLFLDFFDEATTGNPSINIEKIKYKEFKVMAEDAIKMVKARKKAEMELSEAKEYLINLVNSMPSLIIAVDNELNISIINEVALQFFNLNTNDIINKNISELPILNNYIPEYKESLEKFINIIKDKEPFEFNDKKGFLRITISPLLKFSKGLVIRVDDITENVKLENMMIHNEKMMSLGGLAAGMAHEINNPLGIIIQSIQNIERRLDNKLSKNIKIADEIGIDLDKMYKYLEERQIFVSLDYVEEAALRASNIVQNMLEFSRQGASSFDTYNLENIIDTAISLAKYDIDLKKTFKFKDIVINKNISPEVKSVRCNKTEIEQVILNLLKNASQAMCTISDLDYYPEININSYINDDKLVIEIMDNGPGIKESNIDKIFEPFFTTKDLSEGTGLGLSISYYIITNNHKGKIFAENRPEGGAKFTIILPLN